MSWFLWSVAAIAVWGFWGLFNKRALEATGWQQVYLFSVPIVALVVAGILSIGRPDLAGMSRSAIAWALASNAAGVGGVLLFYQALSRGRASVVIPLTAIYPALTVILALLILGEALSLKQGAGILLAVIAVVLLA